MKRRMDKKPTIQLPIWKLVQNQYFADKGELEKAIAASGRSEAELKRKLGAGFLNLDRALSGEPLSVWEVSHIEWGIIP